MRRATLFTGNALQEVAKASRLRCWMVTLTLRPGRRWHAKMISDYLRTLGKWARRRGIKLPYIWVAELQADRMRKLLHRVEEVVHYHVLFWLPPWLSMPRADKQGWWPHGMTRTEVARRPVGYLAKYVSKGEGQSFPKGLRLYADGGLDVLMRQARRWWVAPLYLRGQVASEDRPIRCLGGFLCLATGEFIPSPYEIRLARGPTGRRDVYVHDKADRPASAIAESNKCYVQASREFARASGFTWVEPPARADQPGEPSASELDTMCTKVKRDRPSRRCVGLASLRYSYHRTEDTGRTL